MPGRKLGTAVTSGLHNTGAKSKSKVSLCDTYNMDTTTDMNFPMPHLWVDGTDYGDTNTTTIMGTVDKLRVNYSHAIEQYVIIYDWVVHEHNTQFGTNSADHNFGNINYKLVLSCHTALCMATDDLLKVTNAFLTSQEAKDALNLHANDPPVWI